MSDEQPTLITTLERTLVAVALGADIFDPKSLLARRDVEEFFC